MKPQTIADAIFATPMLLFAAVGLAHLIARAA